jgi:NADPH:quinone reductase-like Zn-dependent oxidoreductase
VRLFVENGRIKPVLAATYPLSQFNEAQRRFMSKSFAGNIVAIPDRHYCAERMA